MNRPTDKLEFNNAWEVADWISTQINHATAHNDTSIRLADAHNYVQRYCLKEGWGKNVWHTILDDAIRMRKEMEEL